jgi:hypothetical protein
MRSSIVASFMALGLAVSMATGCSTTTPSGQPNPDLAQTPPSPDLAQPPPMLTPGIDFSESQALLDAGIVSKQFNFAKTRDLFVRVKVRSMAKVGVEHLKFVNPFGQTVFEANVAFSAEPGMTSMPGDPTTNVFPAKPVPGGYLLDYPVPIAGTVFLRNPFQVVGTWAVSAIFDGSNDTPTASLEVSFTP